MGWAFIGLLPPLLLTLLAAGSFLFSPVRFSQPKSTGYLPAAPAAGQTFFNRHPGLHSIKVHSNTPPAGAVELRLADRQGQLIRQTSLIKPAGTELNFEFRPLETFYTNQSLRFEVIPPAGQLLQLAWSPGDVYAEGAAGTGGDLRFELLYRAGPASIFQTYFDRQATWSGPAWLGLAALPVYLALVVGGFGWLLYHREKFTAENIRHMTGRNCRPVAAYFLLVIMTGTAAWVALIPPLQGMDEQGHAGRTVYQYHYNAEPAQAYRLVEDIYRLERAGRFAEYISAPSFSFERLQSEDFYNRAINTYYHNPLYYSVAGGAIRLAGLLTGDNRLSFQLYVMRFVSLSFGLGASALALALVFYLRRDLPYLLLIVPAGLALFGPAQAHTAVVNNDNAAYFFGTMLALCLAYLVKEGYPAGYSYRFLAQEWKVVVLLAGAVALGILSKRTFLVTVPVVGLLVAGLAYYRLARCWRWPARLTVLAGLGLLVVVLLAGALYLLRGLPAGGPSLNIAGELFASFSLLFLSFWGAVEWVWLHSLGGQGWWLFWLVLTGLSFFGLALAALRRARSGPAGPGWPGLLLAVYALLIASNLVLLNYYIFGGVLRTGQSDYVHGRYLYFLIVPVLVLMAAGLRGLVNPALRAKLPVWGLAYIAGLVLYAYALTVTWGYVLPFYYNQV